MNLNSLSSLLVSGLQDIYDAENRILFALPGMSRAASHDKLKEAFDKHLEETKAQIERLHRVFRLIGVRPDGTTCEAARGLIDESSEVVEATGDPSVKDAALIGAAQRLEHYEIAAYGTACALARQLNHDEAARLLHDSLEEERGADEKLTKLATGGFLATGINKAAEAATS